MLEVIKGKVKTHDKHAAKYYKILFANERHYTIACECNSDTLLNKWLEYINDKSLVHDSFVKWLVAHGIRACEVETTAILDTVNGIIKVT